VTVLFNLSLFALFGNLRKNVLIHLGHRGQILQIIFDTLFELFQQLKTGARFLVKNNTVL